MNYSRQRETILETLKNNPIHPTADQLYELLNTRKNEPQIGIATVYRHLKKLADKGAIKRITGLDNSEHFDHNISEHYHFICKKCKQIYDIDSNIAPDIFKNIEEATGFVIERYDIIAEGICKDCH